MNLDTIIKSYDVRGTYPDQIDEGSVYALGRAFAVHQNAVSIIVARDCRRSSEQLHKEFVRGIREHGTDVYDLGLATTPMLYDATTRYDVHGGAMITASHNPPQYNGIKFITGDAIPIGYTSDLEEIKQIAENGYEAADTTPGSYEKIDITDEYYDAIADVAAFSDTTFSVVVDTANMMGAYELPIYRDLSDTITLTTIYEDLDGMMPNHEANPLNTNTLVDLAHEVQKTNADIGIAYDGDADRVGFVNENGQSVSPHLITALLARHVLSQNPEAVIAYDLPSSRVVKDEIEKHGGTPLQTKVGTVNIKNAMREHDAQFGGEFSGHYYFKEHAYSEAPTRVALMVLNMMASKAKPLSALIADIHRYAHSGEMNFELAEDADKQAILDRFKAAYSDGDITEIDGVRVDYDDWWFLVRPSNTEPLMRMMIEAPDTEMLADKQKELTKLIHS